MSITVNDIKFNDTLHIDEMGVFNCDAVTEKAIMIHVPTGYSPDRTVWIPKSQIKIWEVITDDSLSYEWKRVEVSIPSWLKAKAEGSE